MNPTKEAQINQDVMLTQTEVAKILRVTRETVSRLTHHQSESERLPAYMLGRSPRYDRNEIMWWREKHRFVPTKRRGNK